MASVATARESPRPATEPIGSRRDLVRDEPQVAGDRDVPPSGGCHGSLLS
jgi:hypothetical protein